MAMKAIPFIAEVNSIGFLNIDEKYGITKLINQKRFRVSDTSMTYRQITYLDKDGLLGVDARANGKGWRLFSIKETVFLSLVVELKKYGFTQEQIKPLRHTLIIAGKDEVPNKFVFDELIGLCMSGMEINVVAYSDGQILFFDPIFYSLNREGILNISDNTSFVLIRLNDLVNKAMEMLKKKPIETTTSPTAAYLENAKNTKSVLSEKEQKVVEALRNQEYLSIEVRKKNGDLDVMKVEQLEQYLDNQSQVISLIQQKQYSDIRLVKRDGKVVHLASKDTIKL